jgi:hypothetical protein
MPPWFGRIPSATCGRRHSARSEATIRSQQYVTMQPIPIATPFTAAMTGFGNSLNTWPVVRRRCGKPLMKAAIEVSRWVRVSFRLAPAENAPPASSPVNTATRISLSSAISAQRAAISSLKFSPQQLRASGRLRISQPTWSRFS